MRITFYRQKLLLIMLKEWGIVVTILEFSKYSGMENEMHSLVETPSVTLRWNTYVVTEATMFGKLLRPIFFSISIAN
jgi:hypothetical protein